MGLQTAFQIPFLYLKAEAALRYATKRCVAGVEFARFGRLLGLRMLIRAARPSVSYLLNPVSSTRYVEFPFAFSCLKQTLRRCLDVSSPRLFSLFVGDRFPSARILMINPDEKDLAATRSVVSHLGFPGISTRRCGVEALAGDGEKYDCIWAISVVEHIAGEFDDRMAARALVDKLDAGGRLILTVPVDRSFGDEFRDGDPYGLQASSGGGRYFFQRHYDKAAIWERLVNAVGIEPSIVRWFGETTPGWFADYETRWARDGYGCIVEDAREMADHFSAFARWEEMPGAGVCCLMFEKG